MNQWLPEAIFYEIYPQSFYDSNADGIGDLCGITKKIDYILSLGCNAIWLNPIYDSPLQDAGYDVRDYKKINPRYGTEEDLLRMFRTAHRRGMHILLDLVPGHTSEEHPWFLESKKAESNEFSHRYIWTDSWLKGGDGLNFAAGEADRDGAYILNFFKCQPALNYGFLHPTQDWQRPIDDPECLKTRDALIDVMLYWLDMGCDGFRVDMADSLVKNDDADKSGTVLVWQDILSRVRAKYPSAVFVSEWGRPEQAIKAGFDMDFYLDWCGNGYNALFREYATHRPPFLSKKDSTYEDFSFFKKDSGGTIDAFLDEYMPRYEATKEKGFIALITGNHDTTRISYNLSTMELKLAYAFLFTMPGTPFMYYGDEIGMRYLDLPSKEGGYTRTGSRTPMQWSDSFHMGFSACDRDQLYLPVDEDEDAIAVSLQERSTDSLLNTFRKITTLRRTQPALTDNGNLEIISRSPFVYKRGNLYMAVNPTSQTQRLTLPTKSALSILFLIGGAVVVGNELTISPQTFCTVKINA